MSNNRIVKFSADGFLQDTDLAKPAVAPIGDIVSLIRSRAVAVNKGRMGIWTSSPGRWHRQIREAEFCIFLEGQCTFLPNNGDPIEITAGDVLYFPENSLGIWDITTDCRKAFCIFN